ncbi:MAG: dihydrodipicolinate synthase family protein [Propionicimonas sp.]|nr:dihydrodipicolinate synthase family protein [Propionicimonas sp.]
MSGTTGTADRLAGVIPVLATAFRPDSAVDFDAVEREVDELVEAGAGWLALGYGSEIHCLADEDAAGLSRHVATAAGGRARLLGNVEAASEPGQTLVSIEKAAGLGATAVMLRPSPAQGGTSRAVGDALAGIASAAAVPIVVQDAPQHTGVDLDVSDLAELAAAPGVAGLKIEPPDAAAKIALVKCRLLPGAAPLVAGRGAVDLIREVAAGAEATMPGAGLALSLVSLFRAAERGDRAGAVRSWARLAPLMLLGERNFATFVQLQKTLLARRGVFADDRISPQLGRYDPGLAAEVDDLAAATGATL